MGEVTVIMPTMAESSRSQSLFNAIESVRLASVYEQNIIVVVNGNRRDPVVVERLRGMANIKILDQSIGSLPAACLLGRKAVATEFFCFLDDDDEYIQDAIDFRLNLIKADQSMDFLVTNGFKKSQGGCELLLSETNSISADPMSSLFRENWLSSCGNLFRTSSIGIEYFDDYHQYLEWTWLAYKLILSGKKLGFTEKPTFIINDTPGSASKTEEYFLATLSLYKRMLSLSPPNKIERIIRVRVGNWFHDSADRHMRSGKRKMALKYHFQSLLYPDGLRFFWFLRHLI